MTFNINAFKSFGLALGGARPSLFEVTVADWPGSEESNTPASDKLRFLAKATSLPPSIISEIEVPYFGRRIKIIGDRAYPNWTMTVMNEEDFIVRNALMEWHNRLNDPLGNSMSEGVSPALSTYKRDITVKQYSKSGNPEAPPVGSALVPTSIKSTFECTLIGAFPVNISQIGLDWEAVNQVEQYDVEFAYDYWVSGPNNSGT